jgi:hypothetical protein
LTSCIFSQVMPRREGAGPHRFDDGIGAAQQIDVRRHALGGAQIEHDGLFAAIEVPVQQRDAVDDRERHLTDVVAARILDLDHLCAEVGELHPHRGWPEQRALDHPHAGQQTVRAGRVCSVHCQFSLVRALLPARRTARSRPPGHDAPAGRTGASCQLALVRSAHS